MSRQPKLRPKSHIPGYSDGLYDLGMVAPIADLESRQSFCEERREQRVFRVKRKHVLKACDRCRVKKTKCDGKQPCNRCSAYNHPCLFRERKATQTKVYSRGFVEMLESHHSLVVKALQKLYKHCVNKEGFPGDPLVETADGHPLTHAILDRLGLIKQAEENPDEPEEDTDDLQYLRLLSTSTDSSATSDPSPEPTTPPEPTFGSCTQLTTPSTASAPCWKWEYQPEQYHNYSDRYQGMMPSRPPLAPGPANLTHNVAATAAPQIPSHTPSYLYYLDNDSNEGSMKNRLQPSVMPTPIPHQPTQAPATDPELPVDMLGKYHFPLQDQSLYTGLTPGWNFPAG